MTQGVLSCRRKPTSSATSSLILSNLFSAIGTKKRSKSTSRLKIMKKEREDFFLKVTFFDRLMNFFFFSYKMFRVYFKLNLLHLNLSFSRYQSFHFLFSEINYYASFLFMSVQEHYF